MGADIETLVSAAKEGNKLALEELVLQIQDCIYGLALRMLYDPFDAQDASQEILLKIITHLGTFRGESAFTTWMYRVATNHLLTMRKHRAEREAISFEAYEEDLEIESARNWQESQSNLLQPLFVEEIRISCLQGLLLCLDREHRLAFLLVDVFDVSGEQGAAILDITPAAFRKRLSRAREQLRDFLTRNCSLIGPSNPCKCGYHVASQLDTDRFDDRNMIFTRPPCRRHPQRTPDAGQWESDENLIREMDDLNRIGALYTRYPDLCAPEAFIESIRKLLDSGEYKLL
jgi:RNA polymerase sigma factor (sigma-70 family)